MRIQTTELGIDPDDSEVLVRARTLRKAGGNPKELGEAVEVVGTGMRTFASYVGA